MRPGSGGQASQAGAAGQNLGGAGGTGVTGGTGGMGGAGTSNAGTNPCNHNDPGCHLLRTTPAGGYELCNQGTCSGGKRCFQLTRELGLCDGPEVTEATDCSPSFNADEQPDECGCAPTGGAGGEGGLAARSCSPGKVCRMLTERCSCAPKTANTCVETACETPSDCAEGSVCVPSSLIVGARCIEVECGGDSDCASEERCVAMLNQPQQAGDTFLSWVRCQ